MSLQILTAKFKIFNILILLVLFPFIAKLFIIIKDCGVLHI